MACALKKNSYRVIALPIKVLYLLITFPSSRITIYYSYLSKVKFHVSCQIKNEISLIILMAISNLIRVLNFLFKSRRNLQFITQKKLFGRMHRKKNSCWQQIQSLNHSDRFIADVVITGVIWGLNWSVGGKSVLWVWVCSLFFIAVCCWAFYGLISSASDPIIEE